MKKLFKYIVFAAVALVSASCNDSAIDDLTGLYPAPDEYIVTAAADMGVEKQGNLRIFNVQLTDKDNNVLNMKLAGDSYFLHAASFTPADPGSLRKGNYAIGESTFTRNGGQPQGVVKGNFVTERNDDNYTFSGVLWLADGKVIKIKGSGTLVYTADPEALKLTQVLSVANNIPNGTNSITLNLATDGVTATPNMWGGVDMGGSGNYLAVDFYSTDGTLAPGTYQPADANAMTEMTYGMGWDPGDLWGIGMVFENWGTCWWTVDNGATSAEHITEGAIEVKKSGSVYTITYNHNGLFIEFNGEIPGLADSGNTPAVDYIEISNFLSATLNEGNILSLQLGTDGISLQPNMWGGVDVAGDGNYLKVDLYSADGSIAEGVYEAVDNTALAPMTFAKGYDPGDIWGINMEFKNWGTAWMTRDGGNESGVNITDGTITVEKSGANYVITVTSSAVNVRYTGPINL